MSGFCTCRSPPVSFSGMPLTVILFRESFGEAGERTLRIVDQECAGMSERPEQGPWVRAVLTLMTLTRGEKRALCASFPTIGWPEEESGLCATCPSLSPYTVGSPSSIQSFIRVVREERSNYAQHCILSVTLLGTRGSLSSPTQGILPF